MIYYLLPIVIILVICVLAVFYFDGNETFETLDLGSFDAAKHTNYINCLTGIINGECSDGTKSDCIKSCKNKFQNKGECAPLSIDIRGNSVLQCVESCGQNGGTKCHEDSYGNPIDLTEEAEKYLTKYKSENITKRQTKSGNSYNDFKKQSKCLQECLKCGWNINRVNENCKCKWSSYCETEGLNNYDSYKKNTWDDKSHLFVIDAIPEDQKVTLSWEEQLRKEDIEGYICYVFRKNNIGEVKATKINLYPMDENLKEQLDGGKLRYVYTITNLSNNELYGIQLNKLSKKVFPDKSKLVKPSNTIYVKPSEINIIDFSRNLNSQKEQCSHLAENLLDNFTGREFDINFG